MCFAIAGGNNSDTVCISGMGQDQIQLVSALQFAYPADSTLTLLEGVISSSNTSLIITCGPLEAGATSIDIPAEAEALLSVGMCFALAGGNNSETVCISGIGQDQIQLVSALQFAYPADSTLTLLEGVISSSNTSLIITCGPIEAGVTSIDIPAEIEALLSVGTCFRLEGGNASERACIKGLGPIELMRPTQSAYPADSTLTLLDDVVITCGPLEAGATSIDIPADTEALFSVGNCLALEGGNNSETVCISGLGQGQIQLVHALQFAYPADSRLELLNGVLSDSNTTLVITNKRPIDAGVTTMNMPAEKEALLSVGMTFTLAGGNNSETVVIASLDPVTFESATHHAYPPGSTLTLVIPVGPIDSGATSIEIPSEYLDLVSTGECFLLEGGGNSEVVCIAGFGTILLADPTAYAYPEDSTLTGPITLTTTTTTTEATDDGVHGSASTTGADVVASARDDPHVCTLSGDCYDIRAPSEYTLLRLPYSEQEPVALKLSADLDTDGERPCGLFIKHLALTGSWLNNEVVRIRPYTRNVGGSNWVGNKVMTNFSLQLGNSPWRSFMQKESLQVVAVVGQLTVRFVWREQYGQRMEAQSLEFLVGSGGHHPSLQESSAWKPRLAVLTVSQASHQALNLDMRSMGRLGFSRMGGALGTEGHSKSIEEPSRECRAAAPSSRPDDNRRQKLKPAPPERASTLKASWE
jgi:hypothetical protein